MKNFTHTIQFVSLLLLPPFLYCSQPETAIVLKNAKTKHLPAMAALTRSLFYEDFKPIMLTGYADRFVVKFGLTDYALDSWISDRAEYAKKSCQNQIQKDENTIIALDGKKIVGFCNFEKKEDNNNKKMVFISFLGVDKNHRKQGIGTQLLTEAITTFDDVDTCQLALLAYANDATQQFYEKRKFTNCGLLTVTLLAPDTHYLYVRQLKQ